ncbi:MAG: hypothetical protein K1Y01_10680 [Vicinamibacteria bacterium]|nr:hypothetical protein [Vicinamibacteria bacterium]
MNSFRFLFAIALLPLGCVQGGQQLPPPSATSSPARPAAPAKPATANTPVDKAAEAPAPRPRVRLNIPADTRLPIEIQTPVTTATSREGDPVLAVLTEDVPLEGFKLDKGAEVRGRVLTAVSAKRVKGRAHLVVGFDAVMEKGEKISIATETIDSLAASTSGKDKKIIAGAAVGGLIVGAIKDGGKGAAIGTVIGAAAGTGAVLIMKGDEVEMPRGARLAIKVAK